MSLFVDDIILYIENPKNFTENLLELVNKFSNVAECKINKQKSAVFLYTDKKLSEKERKQYHSIASKTIKHIEI